MEPSIKNTVIMESKSLVILNKRIIILHKLLQFLLPCIVSDSAIMNASVDSGFFTTLCLSIVCKLHMYLANNSNEFPCNLWMEILESTSFQKRRVQMPHYMELNKAIYI